MPSDVRPALSQKKRKEFKRILLNLYNKYVSSFFYLRKHSNANLLPEEKEVLENPKKDNTIVLCKPDKTKGVTILNKSDYIGKMEDILNDDKTFKKVPFDDNIGNLQKFQQFLYRSKKNGCLDDDVYQSLRPTAASTPTLYGLPKLHKTGIPLRPILASTGSFTYKSAKWLSDKLASLRDHPTNLKDSFEFMDQIRKIDNLHTKTLVSFDVKSLFTNIPIDFTIKLVLNQLFHDEQSKINGLSKQTTKMDLQKKQPCNLTKIIITNWMVWQWAHPWLRQWQTSA